MNITDIANDGLVESSRVDFGPLCKMKSHLQHLAVERYPFAVC